MFEKCNPAHPDKVADRIAGAIVDLAYSKSENPKVAVEVLIGHGKCLIINETDTRLKKSDIDNIVKRITSDYASVEYLEVPQDTHLAANQAEKIKCGDNGIFKGTPITPVQNGLTRIAKELYETYKTDGKYLLASREMIICQSNANKKELEERFYYNAIVNPLGDWTGGINVDSGATNRKLGSDMGDSITGGGLHGKDLSKADVSVNIMCHLLAQKNNKIVTAFCAIGDEEVNFYIGSAETTIPYENVVATAKDYIKEIGGFEKFAEWGLIR